MSEPASPFDPTDPGATVRPVSPDSRPPSSSSSIMAAPATLDLSAWYIDRTALGLGVLAVLLGWGFKNAIAGQAVFRDPLEEKRT